jgi:hypothetical protein
MVGTTVSCLYGPEAEYCHRGLLWLSLDLKHVFSSTLNISRPLSSVFFKIYPLQSSSGAAICSVLCKIGLSET